MSLQELSRKAVGLRIAVMWFVLFSANALGTSFIAVMSGCVWELLDTQSRITVCVSIAVNWTGTIMAYLSKASQRIESGESPIIDVESPKPKAL